MSDPTKDTETPERSVHGVAYERKDLTATPIARTIIVLFVMIIGVYIASSILMFVFKARWKPTPSDLPTIHELPPEPRLEVEGPAALHVLIAQEDQLLKHYAWIDQSHGVVRIPIERAMQLIAERGLPAESGKTK